MATSETPFVDDLCNQDRRSFQLHLYGSQAGHAADGWQEIYIDGPYSVRSMQVGQNEFVNSGVAFQVNTFLYHKGDTRPLNTNECIQSRGVGEGFMPCPGRWWIRPIRLDFEMDVIFTPVARGSIQQDTVDSIGLGNLHSHLGLKLAEMANDGGDPTLPATDTYYFLGSYRPRKCLNIYFPQTVYVGLYNGTTLPNWVNTGDLLVDQTGVQAIIGISQFLLAANLGQFNTWHLPSDAANALGNGLDTLQPGDTATYVGDTRFVGPMLIFNLSATAPAHFTLEEFT